jgi:hypothetical protein
MEETVQLSEVTYETQRNLPHSCHFIQQQRDGDWSQVSSGIIRGEKIYCGQQLFCQFFTKPPVPLVVCQQEFRKAWKE